MIAGVLASLGVGRAIRLAGWLLFAAAMAAAVALVMHWRSQAAKYDDLLAQHGAIASRYGCNHRVEAERDLSACLIAREQDALEARQVALERQREESAKAQAALDREMAKAADAARDMDEFISRAAANGDGPVPRVLLETWARRRDARGIR